MLGHSLNRICSRSTETRWWIPKNNTLRNDRSRFHCTWNASYISKCKLITWVKWNMHSEIKNTTFHTSASAWQCIDKAMLLILSRLTQNILTTNHATSDQYSHKTNSIYSFIIIQICQMEGMWKYSACLMLWYALKLYFHMK